MSNDSNREEEHLEATRRHFDKVGVDATKAAATVFEGCIIDAAWQHFRASDPNDLRCRMMLSVIVGVLVGLEKSGQLGSFAVEKVAERLSGKQRSSV